MSACRDTSGPESQLQWISMSALTDRYVAEHFAFAFISSRAAVDSLRVNVVEKVFLVAMAAEALACWADGLAVVACLHVAPVGVQPVLPRLPDFILVSFEVRL